MITDKIIAESMSYATKSSYYSVGSFYFFNKAETLRHASRTGTISKIKFHFYDSSFGSIDWTKDCLKTMDQMYAERAQQIRDTYDYVAVSYSGGSDSSNVIDAFLSNNIKLDEIIVYYPVSVIEKMLPNFNPANKDTSNLIFEYVMACKPALDKISRTHPDIKITILDYTIESIDAINKNQIHTMEVGGQSVSPIFAGQRAVVKRMKDISEKYNNSCCITGAEKPKMLYRPSTRRFAAYFPDFPYSFAKSKVDGFQPMVEHFYHSPDMPSVLHAQVTALKKALEPIFTNETNPLRKTLTFKETPSGDLIIDNESEFVKKIIYKNYNPAIWQAGKTKSYFYQGNVAWIHTNLFDERTHQFYAGQLKEFIDGIHPSLIVYENRKPSKFVDLFSNFYWL